MSKQPAFNPNYPQQPPPQGYAPPPQGYAPPPQGYAAPQGYAPPPQGYAAPPQGAPPGYGAPPAYRPPPQGYAPPPQGYAPPPQGYAPQPQGYAPPPPGYAAQPGVTVHHHHQQTTVVKNQSSLSGTFGGLMKSAGKLAGGAVNTLQKEVDLYASSAQLAKFGTDNIVQLASCASNRYLRVLPNGGVDAIGVPTGVDTQFIVVNHGNNIVSLRGLSTQNKFLTVTSDGRLLCTGVGNFPCKLRLHETNKGYMTFESLSEAGCHIAVLPTGEIKNPKLAKSKDESTHFNVTLLYTRTMATQPAQTHTVYHTTTVVHKK